MEQSVGLTNNIALITSGCLSLAFTIGSLIPALKLDSWGRKKPMMGGALGMALSMMIIAILLSFQGTAHGKAMANASIAFFVTVCLFNWSVYQAKTLT
jgi:predicted MFS family arabinose efflux permease